MARSGTRPLRDKRARVSGPELQAARFMAGLTQFCAKRKIKFRGPTQVQSSTESEHKNLYTKYVGLKIWNPTSLFGALQTVGPHAAGWMAMAMALANQPWWGCGDVTPNEAPQHQEFS
jgi:hypothetical protein